METLSFKANMEMIDGCQRSTDTNKTKAIQQVYMERSRLNLNVKC